MIRRATIEDLPLLAAIEEVAQIAPWSQSLLASCFDPPSCMLVAQDDQGVCGWGGVRTTADEAEILNLAVAPQFRGQGWGRALMQALMDHARANGARMMMLEVRAGNDVAQEMYLDLGFQPCGLRPDYYPAEDGREDAMVMERLL